MTCPSVTNSASDREANGRFAAGNPGGPGNPHNRRLALYREAVERAISVDDIQAILETLRKKAIEGDREAAKMVLQYTLGKSDRFHARARQEEIQAEMETAVLAAMKEAAGERATPRTAPHVAPQTAPKSASPQAATLPVITRRDGTISDSLLARRPEPTVEQLLGITPPSANGVNGRAGAAPCRTRSKDVRPGP